MSARASSKSSDPAKIDDMLASCSTPLAAVLEQIVTLEREAHAATLARMWHQGRHLCYLDGKPQICTDKHGDSVDVGRIASQMFGWKPNHMASVRRFYRAFRRPRDRDRILRTRLKDGRFLTWRVLQPILRFHDETDNEEFERYLQLIVEHSWTRELVVDRVRRDLASENAHRERPDATKNKGPFTIPSSLDGKLVRFMTDTSRLVMADAAIYSNPSHSFITAIRATPREKIVEQAMDILEARQRATDNTIRLIAAMKQRESEFEELESHVMTCVREDSIRRGRADIARILEIDKWQSI